MIAQEPARVGGSLGRVVSRQLCVSWFSAGASSAVATRLAIAEVDEIIYTHIDDQHPDTLRFVKDCEAWFGEPVTIIRNERTVQQVLEKRKYINGPNGAPCTGELKVKVREAWEKQHAGVKLRYVWGFDCDELDRAYDVRQLMPDAEHLFPLIDRRISKAEAHEIMRASGIKRPAMYELGYRNNNCIGCVKGGMGYWNKIRVDFPDVFKARAAMERKVGATCIKGVFLDELSPDRGRDDGPIVDECGILCSAISLRAANT